MPLWKRLALVSLLGLVLVGCSDKKGTLRPIQPTPSAPGTLLLVESGGNLALQDLAASEATSITTDPSGRINTNGQFTADGMRVVWQRNDRDFADQVWVIDKDGVNVRKLVDGLISPLGAVSGNGRVAYTRSVLSNGIPIASTLNIVSLSSGSTRTLPTGAGFKFWPQWSADGNLIAFAEVIGTTLSLVYIDLSAGAAAAPSRPVMEGAAFKRAFPNAPEGGPDLVPTGVFRWSPVGRRIAFILTDGTLAGVFTQDLSDPKSLPVFLAFIDAGGIDSFPEWSGDGNRVFYRGVDQLIDSIDADGLGTPTPVSNEATLVHRIASKGTKLAFMTTGGDVIVSNLDGSSPRVVRSGSPDALALGAFY